jgi:hypothetical protein
MTIALHAKLAGKHSPEWVDEFGEAFETLTEECEQVAVDDLPAVFDADGDGGAE